MRSIIENLVQTFYFHFTWQNKSIICVVCTVHRSNYTVQTLLGCISVSKLSTSDIESSLTSVGVFWSRDFPNMNKDEMGQLKHDEIFVIVARISKAKIGPFGEEGIVAHTFPW